MPMVTQTTNILNEEHIFNEVQLSQIKSHVADIRTHWNKSRDAIIKVGQKLETAKTDKSVTRHMYSKICTDCGFSEKNGDKLITISKSTRINSKTNQNILPVSYGTLYEIATLKDDVFAKAVKDKVINPDCFRKDIESLKKDGSKKKKKDEPKENFKLMSVFIDNSKFVSHDEYLKFRNAVNNVLKNVENIRLDFSPLDTYLEKQVKKDKQEDLKSFGKNCKNQIEMLVSKDKVLNGHLKNKEMSVVLKKELYGDSTKQLEKIYHYTNTLKDRWKFDWRTLTSGTSIEQKCVGDIPEFNEKIAA
jgi:hypothetical protein